MLPNVCTVCVLSLHWDINFNGYMKHKSPESEKSKGQKALGEGNKVNQKHSNKYRLFSCSCPRSFLLRSFMTSPSKISISICKVQNAGMIQHILMILQIPISLNSLSREVDRMAAEKKIVLWCDGKGVAHEGS